MDNFANFVLTGERMFTYTNNIQIINQNNIIMTQYKYVREMERELKKVNEIIDFKILHGFGYREETRIHKKLLSQLGSMKRHKPRFNIFSMLF